MRTISLLVLACFCVNHLHAQLEDQYFFTHYNQRSGLVSHQVNMVLQDGDGFLWIATTEGLQRFDGVRFMTFKPNASDSFALPNKNIIQLLRYDKENFWVRAGDYKVGLFNTKTFRYQPAKITIRDPSAPKHTSEMQRDEDGHFFFIYSRTEVMMWDKEHNEFSERYNFIPTKGRDVSDIKQQPGTKKYWIGTDKGIVIFNKVTGAISDPLNNTEKELMVDKLSKVDFANNFLFDKKGRVWFDYWNPSPVICCYSLATGTPVVVDYSFKPVFKSYYEIKGIMQQRDGSIWVRGLKLFARFQEDSKKFLLVENGFQKEQGIAYDFVGQLYEDHENNIWVSTSNKGLYRFNPSRQFFTNISHRNRRNGQKGNGSVMSFAVTRKGNILSGAWDDGLYLYNKDLKEIPFESKYLEENKFIAGWGMDVSNDSNTIWISSQPGLHAYRQRQGISKMYNPPQLMNKTIRQVVEDEHGNVWLGMQSIGLFKWDAAAVQKENAAAIRKIEAVAPDHINRLMQDSRGRIWVATGSSGMYVIDTQTDKVVLHITSKSKDSTRLLGDAISSVLEYAQDSMLITNTTDVYLYKPSTGSLTQIGNSYSVSGYITASVKDANGFVWISTTNGIYRVNLQKQSFAHFNVDDGIADNQFTLSSSFVLPDNRILFGSSVFVAFNPKAIVAKDSLNEVKITNIMVRNNSLLVDSITQLKEMILEPGDNSLVIEFSTMVLSPSHALIKYKLDNLDNEWHYSDQAYRAVYSYLPPGSYTFLITSENADGRESGKVTKLYFTVQAHFWQTWWFYGLLALLAAALFYWYDSERMKRKEDLQKMRENIAGNLHEEINTALSNINILSEMARRKAETDPTKSKDYIELIHNRSGNMMTAMDDMLWSIDPHNDSMEKTLERIREYTEALEKEKGIETELWVDQKVTSVPLNMKLRYEAFQLLKEILDSLDGDGKCKIHVGLEHGKLDFILQYENEQNKMEGISGLDQKPGMQKRLTMACATMEVQVHQRSGLVELQIPI